MGMHSSSDAFNYIESFTNLERNTSCVSSEYKLDRMTYMLEAVGHPEKAFRSVHIAGSKGKGSTASIISAMLSANGYKTGMFTSPHLVSYKERITLAGTFFPDDIYVKNTKLINEMLESGKLTGKLGQPTTFELLTLLAFMIFREQECRWAVIETGIGGRLDATNLIVPEVSIITPIELEHCAILGDTIEKIASEKAGIIKQGVPVVVQHQKPEALKVLKARALEKGSKFIYADDCTGISEVKMGISGSDFKLTLDGAAYPVKTNLTGSFQCDNIASALLAIKEILPDTDIHTSIDALSHVKLEGRLEITGKKPPVVIDGSHTAYSVQRLAESCKAIFGRGGILVFGSVLGKDYRAMLDILIPAFDAVIISRPEGLKETDVEAVYAYAKKKCKDKVIEFEESPSLALDKAIAMTSEKPVVVTGSFYLAGAVKRHLKEKNRK